MDAEGFWAVLGLLRRVLRTISIGGAEIAYGAWFYLVAGIAVVSLVVSVGIYWVGNATSVRSARDDT